MYSIELFLEVGLNALNLFGRKFKSTANLSIQIHIFLNTKFKKKNLPALY
jgi:hypothetical protein